VPSFDAAVVGAAPAGSVAVRSVEFFEVKSIMKEAVAWGPILHFNTRGACP
jgi:hypothetical protein